MVYGSQDESAQAAKRIAENSARTAAMMKLYAEITQSLDANKVL